MGGRGVGYPIPVRGFLCGGGLDVLCFIFIVFCVFVFVKCGVEFKGWENCSGVKINCGFG